LLGDVCHYKQASTKSLAAARRGILGGADILFNNAGTGSNETIMEGAR